MNILNQHFDKIYCIKDVKKESQFIHQLTLKKNNCYIYIDRIDDIFYIGGIRTTQSTYVLDLFKNGERIFFFDLDNSFVKTFCSLKEYRKIKLEKIK
jgi:hypothetical protein